MDEQDTGVPVAERLADPIDAAADYAERFLADALARQAEALKRDAEEWKPEGVCHNCGESLAAGSYCDDDCRQDHEYRLRVRKASGAA